MQITYGPVIFQIYCSEYLRAESESPATAQWNKNSRKYLNQKILTSGSALYYGDADDSSIPPDDREMWKKK